MVLVQVQSGSILSEYSSLVRIFVLQTKEMSSILITSIIYLYIDRLLNIMPQLDFFTIPNILICLCMTYFIGYIFLAHFYLPKLYKNMYLRKLLMRKLNATFTSISKTNFILITKKYTTILEIFILYIQIIHKELYKSISIYLNIAKIKFIKFWMNRFK